MIAMNRRVILVLAGLSLLLCLGSAAISITGGGSSWIRIHPRVGRWQVLLDTYRDGVRLCLFHYNEMPLVGPAA